MAFAVEVDGLEKTFGGETRALAGVSFGIEEGTVFGLLGPNGAGKTTAVRVLTTTVIPDRGSATILGHDVVKEPTVVRRLFGLAGQFAAVDGNLTGRENLSMIGSLNHLPRAAVVARAGEILEQFQLTEAADRAVKTYSGGMRRRLDLGAALVARPKVLFLDEPTTGLDPQSRNDLWAVIERLVDEGTTVLLTTQYLEEADRLASQLAVIDHGRVISAGTPTELKADLGATVLEVEAANDRDASRIAEILASLGPHRPRVSGSSVEVTVDDGPRTAMEALRRIDAATIEPAAFTLREPSLDDVFLALTGRETESATPNEPDKKRRRGRK